MATKVKIVNKAGDSREVELESDASLQVSEGTLIAFEDLELNPTALQKVGDDLAKGRSNKRPCR